MKIKNKSVRGYCSTLTLMMLISWIHIYRLFHSRGGYIINTCLTMCLSPLLLQLWPIRAGRRTSVLWRLVSAIDSRSFGCCGLLSGAFTDEARSSAFPGCSIGLGSEDFGGQVNALSSSGFCGVGDCTVMLVEGGCTDFGKWCHCDVCACVCMGGRGWCKCNINFNAIFNRILHCAKISIWQQAENPPQMTHQQSHMDKWHKLPRKKLSSFTWKLTKSHIRVWSRYTVAASSIKRLVVIKWMSLKQKMCVPFGILCKWIGFEYGWFQGKCFKNQLKNIHFFISSLNGAISCINILLHFLT